MILNNLEAVQAHQALAELGKRDDIPIRASLDIAYLSNLIETQLKAYRVVLRNLYKKYSIKPEANEDGFVRFTCTLKGDAERKENLEAFSEKFNELLEAKTEDFSPKKIKLPDTIMVKAEVLKALTDFVEIE